MLPGETEDQTVLTTLFNIGFVDSGKKKHKKIGVTSQLNPEH